MEDNQILEPLDLYNSRYKEELSNNTKKYIDNLVKKSGVDVELNRATVKKYKAKSALLNDAKSKRGMLNFWKVFLIILSIVSFVLAICGIFLIVYSNDGSPLGIGLCIGGIIFGIGSILIITLVLKSRIAKQNSLVFTLSKEINTLLQECYDQMAPLNALYDWNMSSDILNETTKLIQLDKIFDIKKFDYMNEKYHFSKISMQNVSTMGVLSGSIIGNPFLVIKNFIQFDSTKTYIGTLLITWTETYRDSEGNLRTRTRTQTLTASVTKWCPGYCDKTYLVYANDAAPDLTFSRNPTVNINWSDDKIESVIKKHAKQNEKLTRKSITSNSTFTQMSNDEFESLFNSRDRNNELQFRLLFTPLAQINMCKLLRSKAPYGDDFNFTKSKCLNFITSEHAQTTNFDLDPELFITYDIDFAIRNFCNLHETLLRALYFDLAPLISIPLYQQTKSQEYIYKKEYESNFTSYEEETLANAIGQNKFSDKESITSSILKVNHVDKNAIYDKAVVTAHSYKGIKHIELVPVLGGDGHLHSVPVEWIEYIPIQKETVMEVANGNMTRYQYNNKQYGEEIKDYFSRYESTNNGVFRHGLLAYLVNSVYNGNK